MLTRRESTTVEGELNADWPGDAAMTTGPRAGPTQDVIDFVAVARSVGVDASSTSCGGYAAEAAGFARPMTL
jgi:hypothetical protein